MKAVQKITIIGATGMLGRPVTQVLAKEGFEITALVRSVAMAKKVLPHTVKLVEGNLKDKESIRKALGNADAVYLSLSVKPEEGPDDFHPELDGLKLLIETAREVGVMRILYLSSLVKDYQGFDWWVFRLKRAAVQMVRDSGLDYTIFYPSNFMETLSNLNLQGQRLVLSGQQKTRSYWIAAADYGLQLAHALHKRETIGQEYIIQGPVAMTYDEAADEFIRHYRPKKLKKMRIPIGLIKFFGRLSRQAQYGAYIMEAINQYDEQFGADKSWKELGQPKTALKQYASSL